jgi:hypothetical protein
MPLRAGSHCLLVEHVALSIGVLRPIFFSAYLKSPKDVYLRCYVHHRLALTMKTWRHRRAATPFAAHNETVSVERPLHINRPAPVLARSNATGLPPRSE